MNIIQAIHDPNLFGPYFGNDTDSWKPWLAMLRTVYGLPLQPGDRKVVERCTLRDADALPADGFDTALILTGRRSGKSRMSAAMGAFEAALAGHEKKLAKGERGVVAIVAPTKAQGTIVRDYIRGAFESPLLANELKKETHSGFELRNGIRIEIIAGDWRTVRGYTLVAAIVDEACFFGYEAESKVRSDTELVRAIKPALATTGGRLIAISSPYAKRGWCYAQDKRHRGNNSSKTLVWRCPSRTMNPTLPQSLIDDALAEDKAAARSEYLGEWRDDVAEFIPRSLVESLVVAGRRECRYTHTCQYVGFCDMSGGRADDAALAIGHRANGKVVVDLLRQYRPPFSPNAVITEMSDELQRYGLRRVTGDNYAAEFVAMSFMGHGIKYLRAPLPKSQIYSEALPHLCSGGVELLDNETLIDQLANLERRTRSGGRDAIDHPAGQHDDLANAVAGLVVATNARTRRAGGIL